MARAAGCFKTLTILTNLLPYVPGYTGYSSYVRRVMPGFPGLRLVVSADDRGICRNDDWLPEGPPTSRWLALLHQLSFTQHGVDSKAALRQAGVGISDLQVVYSPYCDALLRWRGVPQVITCHDLTPLFYPNSQRAALRYRFWTPLHLKKASGVIAISRFVADQLVNFGVPASKIEVIPNGIEIKGEPIKDPLSADLIVIARHDCNKNVLFVVKAFASLLELQPAWTGCLVIVGKSGSETKGLIRIAKQLSHPNRIVLVDKLTSRDLSARMRSSLALISASRMEGFDYSILEAQAEGLPTLVSDIPVHREFHGEASIFFDLDKEPSKLARKIIDLAKNRNLWRFFSDAGNVNCDRLGLCLQRRSISSFLSQF
jgi:glycosyltransferase involved in cell wall biosynthesis